MQESTSRSAHRSPKVLALLPKVVENAVDYYRIVSAFDVLRDRDYPVEYVPYSVARNLVTEGHVDPAQYDVFVLCRATAAEHDRRILQFIEVLQQAGKVVVYETDDDYTNEHRKATEGNAIPVAQACGAVTCSTPYLAKVLRQHNERVYVLPNAINFDIWDKVERQTGERITIGLAGTGTHFEDYRLVADALFRLAERDNVRFLLVGYAPYYFEDLPNMEFVSPRPYPRYAMALGQVDIGLCPLVPDDKFNLAKSAIKALEWMAAGAAVIAQDMPVYRRVVAKKSNGLLASGDWYEKILLLVDDERLRRKLAQSGRRWVKKHRDIRTHARKWWRVYEEVMQ